MPWVDISGLWHARAMQSIDNLAGKSTALEFTEAGLRAANFNGFVSFTALKRHRDEDLKLPGVYVVLREWPTNAQLMEFEPMFKYKDGSPMRPLAELQSAWDLATPVLYIGKAGDLNRGVGLKKRLSQFRRYGGGTADNHAGGRAIWQVPNALEDLRICWIATPGLHPECVERQLLAQFKNDFGSLPMANQQGWDQNCKNTPHCWWGRPASSYRGRLLRVGPAGSQLLLNRHPHRNHNVVEAVTGVDGDELAAVLLAGMELVQVSLLSVLESLFATKELHRSRVLRTLVLDGDVQVREVNIQTLRL